MHALHTAILEHTTPAGVHYDWLIEDPSLADPRHPDHRLWTARVQPAPDAWAALRRFDLQVIPPHRRAYLTYQGEVSGNRGRVRRVLCGRAFALSWRASRIVIDVESPVFNATLDLRARSGSRWQATVLT